MSGGRLFVHDPADVLDMRLNGDLVVARAVSSVDELRGLLERHVRYTGSALAEGLLSRWEASVREFREVVPKTDVAAVEDEHEGTLPGGKHAEPGAEAAAASP